MNPNAARYERRSPETGIGEAQAAERMERLDHRDAARSGRSRRGSITVPDLPWLNNKPEEAGDERAE